MTSPGINGCTEEFDKVRQVLFEKRTSYAREGRAAPVEGWAVFVEILLPRHHLNL